MRFCAGWIENPYYQLFCGEEFSARAGVRPLVDDALAPAHGRGEARRADPGEPLGATRTGAAKPADFSKLSPRWSRSRARECPSLHLLRREARDGRPCCGPALRRGSSDQIRFGSNAPSRWRGMRMSILAVSVSTVFFEEPLRRFREPSAASLSRMIVELGVQHPLRQSLLQLIEKTVLRKHSFRLAATQLTVQRVPLDRPIRPLSAIRAPRTKFLTVPYIGKGKVRRPYEFGVKVSLVMALHHSKTIGSRSISQARSDASPNTSSARCVAGRPSSRLSATPKVSIAWAEWPRRPMGRRGQRRPRRRGVQFPKTAGVARALAVRIPAMARPATLRHHPVVA